jgi:ParB family chromosome partitioning protein
MTPTDTPLALIDVPAGRARSFDPAWAEALAAIIAVQGLTHPVTLRPAGERFRLVAGLHRLEAARLLGWAAIPARLSAADSDDAARLEEVMENLGRQELTALDRCQHLYELKQVWERMHPQAKHGKAPKPKKEKRQSLPLSTDDRNAPPVFGFSQAVADKVDLSARSIRAAVTIWTRLHPPLRRRLVGMPLAAKQTELKALSELRTNSQVRVVDLILSDAPEHRDIGNVAQALEFIANGVLPTALERRFLTASRTLAALDDDLFGAVIAAHRDRVLAALGLGGDG